MLFLKDFCPSLQNEWRQKKWMHFIIFNISDNRWSLIIWWCTINEIRHKNIILRVTDPLPWNSIDAKIYIRKFNMCSTLTYFVNNKLYTCCEYWQVGWQNKSCIMYVIYYYVLHLIKIPWTRFLTILFIFHKLIFILTKSYQENCQERGLNSWPSAIKAIVLSTPPWVTHWAKPKIMSSAYKCRSNLPIQVVGMARIGNTQDMPTNINATKHQNV